MTAKEKQGFGLYFLFAFGMAWLCQVGGCMALLQQNNAVLYQLALIVTMFCPLLAVLLVQKAFLRQPTGIGWKVQGKRRFWLAAAGPAVNFLLASLWALRLGRNMTIRGSAFFAANLLTGGFNLLPIPPLDGAQMAASLYAVWNSRKKLAGND